jgi:hypothetical protein
MLRRIYNKIIQPMKLDLSEEKGADYLFRNDLFWVFLEKLMNSRDF